MPPRLPHTLHLEHNTAWCLSVLQADTEADEADPEGAALRRLQQLPASADGFAQAASGIFTNIFDFFRSNGEHLTALVLLLG